MIKKLFFSYLPAFYLAVHLAFYPAMAYSAPVVGPVKAAVERYNSLRNDIKAVTKTLTKINSKHGSAWAVAIEQETIKELPQAFFSNGVALIQKNGVPVQVNLLEVNAKQTIFQINGKRFIYNPRDSYENITANIRKILSTSDSFTEWFIPSARAVGLESIVALAVIGMIIIISSSAMYQESKRIEAKDRESVETSPGDAR